MVPTKQQLASITEALTASTTTAAKQQRNSETAHTRARRMTIGSNSSSKLVECATPKKVDFGHLW